MPAPLRQRMVVWALPVWHDFCFMWGASHGSDRGKLPLPVAVQAEKATAKLKNGILEISMPKSELA